MELLRTKSGEPTLIGVRNDGVRFEIAPDYYHPGPMVVYGGSFTRLPFDPADLQRLARLDQEELRAFLARFSVNRADPARLARPDPEELRASRAFFDSLEFKFSPRPIELVTKATVLNVIVPRDPSEMADGLHSLLWRCSPSEEQKTTTAR